MTDNEFEEATLAQVTAEGTAWSIKRADGWSFFVPATSPIAPAVGMTARFYGKGIGYPVRGLFLDGVEVFYRTVEQEKEYSEIQSYGANAADWLARWDRGDGVWSIEMGGLGPGYEQSIQITTAEMLRWFLANPPTPEVWEEKEAWQLMRDRMDKDVGELAIIKALGLSGAQWGAAQSLASSLYRQGPRAVMTDEKLKDRRIQTRRDFPQGARA